MKKHQLDESSSATASSQFVHMAHPDFFLREYLVVSELICTFATLFNDDYGGKKKH